MVEEAEASSNMSALAILSCRQSSHPFQERHIALHEPAKIGRSVARARPSPNNGIFDCKVLSRNHAMLWYENGTFYLQDTKSSNGTFINDQRLCKGGEESPPREVYSGDLIQFGVNVMENNRRGEKITHGCIIATITLYHPDGREAKPVLFNTPTPGITIQSQDLYKLAQYLQEALHREKMLEQKLSNLQQLVHNTQESSEGGWQALIDEDRLLSRLEVLENQLHAYSKNHTEDTLRQELVTLQEEKLNYETTAKESLMKVLQEKIEAVTKLSDLERSLSISEDECSHLREACEKSQEELQYLAEKYQDQLKAVQDVQIELQDAETKHLEEMEKVEKDKLVLTEKLDDMIKQEATLTAKVLALQADNELSSEHLKQLKEINEDDHLNNMKTVDSDQEKSVDSDHEVISSVIIPVSMDNKEDKDSKDQLPEDVEGKLKETQQQIEIYKGKLEESERQLEISAAKVEELQRELESTRLESRQYLAKITSLEDKLKLSDLHMNQMVENTMADLTLQMSENNKQSNSTQDLIGALQDQIRDLEEELALYKIPQQDKLQDSKLETTLVASNDDVDSSTLVARHRRIHEDAELEKLLSEAKTLLSKTEIELGQCKVDLDESKLLVRKTTEENSALKTDLDAAQSLLSEKSNLVLSLQEQIDASENSAKKLQQQILELTGSLEEEKTKHKDTKESLDVVEKALEVEKNKHKDSMKTLEDTKKSLSESQQTAKQAQNEATQLRNKNRHQAEATEAEFSRVRDRRSMPGGRGIPHLKYPYQSPDTPSRLPVSKRQANEFTAVKEECASLRKRIQAIESEMKMSRRENLQLSAEYNKLQESYRQLEALKDKLQDKETLWMSNLTDSQKETESSKQELQKAKEEIASLKKKCEECDHEINRLKGELKKLSGDYGHIAKRSKVISFVSCIPLLMLLFAILLALYPTLETFTATAT